jgi:hypothetical protein
MGCCVSFKSEDAPLWAPATTMGRAELYNYKNGTHHYRGNRMLSSPAAVATRFEKCPVLRLLPQELLL